MLLITIRSASLVRIFISVGTEVDEVPFCTTFISAPISETLEVFTPLNLTEPNASPSTVAAKLPLSVDDFFKTINGSSLSVVDLVKSDKIELPADVAILNLPPFT